MVAGGCAQILGLGDFEDAPANGGEGGAASTSDASSTSTSASTGGGEGGASCADGATQPCYSGPEGTEGQGLCLGGEQTCDGGTWGACEGEVLPAAEDCSTPASEDCVANCGELQWAHLWQNPGLDRVTRLGVGTDGRMTLATSYPGSIDFGGGVLASSNQPTLVHFAADGSYAWGRVLTSPGSLTLQRVAVAPSGSTLACLQLDGAISLGSTTITSPAGGFGVLVSFGPSGDYEWHLALGDGPNACSALAFDPAGNILVGGTLSAHWLVPLFGDVAPVGGVDGWLAKLDATGGMIKFKQFGSASDEAVTDLASDAAGSIYVVGTFSAPLSVGGSVLTASGNDAFAAQFDAGAFHVWSRAMGMQDVSAGPPCVAAAGTSEFIVGGSFVGSADLGCGTLTSAGAGAPGVFLAKLGASDGGCVNSIALGSPAGATLRELSAEPGGGVFLSGSFASVIDLGGGPLVASGATTDAFVGLLEVDGSHLWSMGAPGPGASVGSDASGRLRLAIALEGDVTLGGTAYAALDTDILVGELASPRP